MKAEEINRIFRESITDYHLQDHVDAVRPEKYEGLEGLLYLKNWIDTVQWHLEDIIRDPSINPAELVAIKRRIDASNQHRTDTVEQIDEWIFNSLQGVKPAEHARLNSETPAWLLDRMSILQLKIYHFNEQLQRTDATQSHLDSVKQKLYVLQVQEADLALAYDELMDDLRSGQKYMKLYKQMKMYNDPNLNPIFYEKK
ncbi:DUF4254 domain-containing protein [Leadbetterella sp. DM7]|uniref:DUF4254 domain-containing protein n=1 Tax=Leadbetterella sp. DM7 TaxID=3235085 RepID=UPI00349EC364